MFVASLKNFNELACEYFDKLNKQFGWNLQHAKNGGEVELIGYFPDAYDKEKNIIVEYDEPHHYDIYGKLRERDVKRMNDLMRETDCKFYRYNEKLGRMNEYINELKP